MGNGRRTSSRHTIGRTIGGTIGGAIDLAVGGVGKLVGSAIGVSGMASRTARRPRPKPGSAPGIESMPDVNTPPEPGRILIQCIDYGPHRIEKIDVTDIDAFLETPRPEWAAVRWINIDGLHPYVVNRVQKKFNLHLLAAEDVMHVPQRPKAEDYDNELFLIARMLTMTDGHLVAEQISMFYQKHLLISFQETHGDIWDPIRERMASTTSRLRTSGASFLMYALLDALVDFCFPILETFGDHLEDLELRVTENPTPELLHEVHAIKRELVMLRRVMWPMREMMANLQREDHACIPNAVRPYMRDVYDHTIQIIDVIETYREMGAGLTDLYMSAVSNRMNEVMKVLTIMATLFIPITFIAGVYGMNFDNMPELHTQYGYYGVWVVFVVITAGLLIYFRRKKWI
ncbi:MAG: magnesium/cobalt transporter CorA [Planctomycetes bacterium]|nr:magnesium/cobalt transporter CorA [Planctomycetota bacterium]